MKSGLMKNVAIAAGAFTLGVSSFALAVPGNDLGAYLGLVGLKTDASVNPTGGLVFSGENRVAPTVSVVNTRDGVGPRSPVFTTTGRSDDRSLDTARSLVKHSSIENQTSLELERGRNGEGWTFFVTNDNSLILRKREKAGNWTNFQFFELEKTRVCPVDGKIGGNRIALADAENFELVKEDRDAAPFPGLRRVRLAGCSPA